MLELLLHIPPMSVKKLAPLTEDPQQLKKKLAIALRYYELPSTINGAVLHKWVNESENPMHFISRVFQDAYFESELEAEKLLDLLTRLWNATPRSELGGLSPQQKFAVDSYNRNHD